MKNVNDKIKVYLITGVAGFIGANLAKRILNLQNEKIHIIGIDNLNDYYDVKLKEYRLSELQKFDEFEFIKCDISNKEKIGQIFEKYKPDIVVNLAAQAGVRYKYLPESRNYCRFRNRRNGEQQHPRFSRGNAFCRIAR